MYSSDYKKEWYSGCTGVNYLGKWNYAFEICINYGLRIKTQRSFAAFKGGGDINAGFFLNLNLPTFGFANREINRNAKMLMLTFQLWLCLCLLLGLLISHLLNSRGWSMCLSGSWTCLSQALKAQPIPGVLGKAGMENRKNNIQPIL